MKLMLVYQSSHTVCHMWSLFGPDNTVCSQVVFTVLHRGTQRATVFGNSKSCILSFPPNSFYSLIKFGGTGVVGEGLPVCSRISTKSDWLMG